MKKIFLRRDSARFSKFGKRRKKLLGWKRPKGRDNKMREKRRGYASVVSIGYSSDKEKVNKIKEKTPIQIKNTKDLNKIQKDKKMANIYLFKGWVKPFRYRILIVSPDRFLRLTFFFYLVLCPVFATTLQKGVFHISPGHVLFSGLFPRGRFRLILAWLFV